MAPGRCTSSKTSRGWNVSAASTAAAPEVIRVTASPHRVRRRVVRCHVVTTIATRWQGRSETARGLHSPWRESVWPPEHMRAQTDERA
jgi:hypothetical protein